MLVPVLDNYATHKHPKIKAWLDRHARFKSHFTPTSSSWMNLVERFFADLTAHVIRSGSFASISELVRDIEAIFPIATPPQSPTLGKPKAPQSSKKSTVPAPPSIKSRQHELL